MWVKRGLHHLFFIYKSLVLLKPLFLCRLHRKKVILINAPTNEASAAIMKLVITLMLLLSCFILFNFSGTLHTKFIKFINKLKIKIKNACCRD